MTALRHHLPDFAPVPPVDFTRSIPPLPPLMAQRMRDSLIALSNNPDLGHIIRIANPGGTVEDRNAAAKWLQPRFGMPIDVDRIVVTNGTQSAILMLMEGLAGRDGLVFAESLSWGVVKSLAQRAHVRLKGLPIDEEGLIPAAFEAACLEDRPKVLYCNPTDHNPTTAMMPEARRMQIIDIARRFGVAIVEDDAIGRLHLGAPRPIAALAPDLVWYVMGLTKCLAQGLRMAYLVAPSREKIDVVLGGEFRLSHWVPSPLTTIIVSRWIEDGSADELCDAIRCETEAREQLAVHILQGADIAIKPAAMHLWLRLPEGRDRHAFIDELKRRGVLVRPAELFAVDDAPLPNSLRLSLSSPLKREDVERGLRIIASALGLSNAR